MPCEKGKAFHKPEQQTCPVTGQIKGCCNCCTASSFSAKADPKFYLDDFQRRDGGTAIRIQEELV